ncbi:hypothetical protein Tco_0598814 [Tanacetum coccineum]
MRIRYRKVCKMTGERILKDHWKERLEDKDDDSDENLEDPDFNNTSENEDNLEGLLDYLKPISYDGFIDLDNEAYNKRRCKLLGIPYEEPTPILIENAKVNRYIIGLRETYTKVKVLGVEKIPRTRDNVATTRARLMKKWPKKEIIKQRRRAS